MTEVVNQSEATSSPSPTLVEAFWVWFRIGVLSFGGPAAQIALVHREVVEARGWLKEQQYLNALSFCMLLPGPEAMQLVTYAGWRLHGVVGGLVAGLCFVVPGAIVIAVLATIYAFYGDVPLVSALFLGVKAAVIIIVIEALIKVSKRALVQREHWLIALLAFIAIFFLAVPFPLIIGSAALVGFLRATNNNDDSTLPRPTYSNSSPAATTLIWLTIWWIPLFALMALDDGQLIFEIGLFFSKLAVVTFGGAYAVLAYLGQDVVGHYGWLEAGEMMDGLGLAETTPGPLILVNEFVGFIAGFRSGGLGMGLLGAFVTLWATFVPCFLWIFVGAPFIDWLGAQAKLRNALAAITAAVVGVMLNLSIWFALNVYFGTVEANAVGPLRLWTPSLASFDWRVLVLSVVCAVLLLALRWSVVRVLCLSALGGLALSYIAP